MGRRRFLDSGEVGKAGSENLGPLGGVVFTERAVVPQVNGNDALDDLRYEGGVGCGH